MILFDIVHFVRLFNFVCICTLLYIFVWICPWPLSAILRICTICCLNLCYFITFYDFIYFLPYRLSAIRPWSIVLQCGVCQHAENPLSAYWHTPYTYVECANMLKVAFQHVGTHHIRFCTIHTWFCVIFNDLCLIFNDARFKRFKRLLRLVGNTYVFVSFKRLNLAHIWHMALCDDMLCFCKIYIWFCLFFDDLCLIFDDGRFKWFKRLLLYGSLIP